MKTLALSYEGYKLDYRINLGDNIQTIAATRLLPQVDGYVSRESLNKVDSPCIVSLNGFFMDSSNWPPNDNVVPIPYAFHVSRKYQKNICSKEGLSYLKQHQPIGCRDQESANILKKHGVDAFYSKCLTLTLDRREKAPTNGKVYIVGVTKQLQKVIPPQIKDGSVYVEQSKVELPNVPNEQRLAIAEHLLADFKQNASLIITSRIHCAMPCIAMGIPVVFLFNKQKEADYRVHLIEDLIGINYIQAPLLFSKWIACYYSNKINWSPEVLNIESEKTKIKKGYLEAYEAAKVRFNEKFG